MTRSARRGAWSPEEDEGLMTLIESQGPNNWVRIAQQVQRRTPKQCRERYHQNLKPTLRHDPITAHEGERIERFVAEFGPRWADIARMLGNRSDNAVKNWWNGSVNRRKRNPAQATAGFKHVGPRLLPMSFTSAREKRPHTHLQPHEHHLRSTAGPYHPIANKWSNDQRGSGQNYQPVYQSGHSTAEMSVSRKVSDTSSTAPHTQYTNRRPSFCSQPYLMTHTQSRPLDLPRPELPSLRATAFNSTNPVERRNSAFDRPLVSPALSETSQSAVSSRRYPPSLISDNQSTYSISPRTMPSPRMTYPATASQADCHLRGIPMLSSTSHNTVPMKSPQQHWDAASASESYNKKRSITRPTIQTSTYAQAADSAVSPVKDARMQLARLLD